VTPTERPWLVVVNSLATMIPSQTTTGLIARALRRGQPVAVAAADALDTRPDGEIVASARLLRPGLDPGEEAVIAAVRRAPPVDLPLTAAGLVWARVNPGKGPAPVHSLLVDQLGVAADRGVPVLNHPRGLAVARTKHYLSRLPAAARPQTLVTRNAASARDFLETLDGPAVIKPVLGTRGKDVFLVRDAQDPNLNQILDVVFRGGHAMIQAFVPEAREGDTRVLLLDGELLRVDGVPAVVRRVPSGPDFRSNVHVGGVAAPGEMRARFEALAALVGPRLREDGLFLVGLDVIGEVIVECNVFSPGGFNELRQFTGVDFLDAVLTAAAARAR
jgi:glutathione synthase